MAEAESSQVKAFQSLVANSSYQRRDLSRTIQFWDSLPRFCYENLNTTNELLRPETKTINLLGERVRVTIRPAHFELGGETINRFPGTVELHVELALIKMATEHHFHHDPGSTGTISNYGLVFNMRDLRRKLEEIGYSYNHKQCKRALFTLATAGISVSTKSERRETVSFMNYIDELSAVSEENQQLYGSKEGNFYIRFNRFMSKAIDSAQYRQISLKDLRKKKSFMIYLLQQMQLQGTNLSSEHPFSLRFTDLREATCGLRHSKLRQAINLFEKELAHIREEGIITDWDREDILDRKSSAGRPAIVDVNYRLYPSNRFVSQIKAANHSQTESEKELRLTPRKRGERQFELAFGSWS